MITATDKAWLAGVFDSAIHASLTIQRLQDREYVRWHMYTSLSDDIMIQHMVDLTGSNFSRWNSRNVTLRKQCAMHCPKAHIHVFERRGPCRINIAGTRLWIVLHGIQRYRVSGGGDDLATVARIVRNQRTEIWILNQMKDLGWTLPPFLERSLKAKAS